MDKEEDYEVLNYTMDNYGNKIQESATWSVNSKWTDFISKLIHDPSPSISHIQNHKAIEESVIFHDHVIEEVKKTNTVNERGQTLMYLLCRFRPKLAISAILSIIKAELTSKSAKLEYKSAESESKSKHKIEFNINNYKNDDGDFPQHGYLWEYKHKRIDNNELLFVLWIAGADFNLKNSSCESSKDILDDVREMTDYKKKNSANILKFLNDYIRLSHTHLDDTITFKSKGKQKWNSNKENDRYITSIPKVLNITWKEYIDKTIKTDIHKYITTITSELSSVLAEQWLKEKIKYEVKEMKNNKCKKKKNTIKIYT